MMTRRRLALGALLSLALWIVLIVGMNALLGS